MSRSDLERLDDVIAAAAAISAHSIVAATIEHDLPPLLAAAERLRSRA